MDGHRCASAGDRARRERRSATRAILTHLYAQLAPLNATLNAAATILLVIGHRHMNHGRIPQHRRYMESAFAVSVVFLISYLLYHYEVGDVGFRGEGWVRPVYFAILITHTLLAATVPFIATITLWRALRGRIDAHRRIARWTYPIWMYVSVTGVIVYLMVYQIYGPPMINAG